MEFWKKNDPGNMPSFAMFQNCYLSLTDLKRGRVESAKSRLAEVEDQLPQASPLLKVWISGLHQICLGELWLAQNLPGKAVELFEKKTQPWPFPDMQDIWLWIYNTPIDKDILARAYQQKGEIDRAIAEYERLTTIDPKSQNRMLIFPRYHFRLAKLYEQEGLKAKAAERYRRFLELWKDADPGRPEVEEAKKRLAGLEAN
jgi:tetratricopeptide (TPR) repeat protein